MIPKILIKIYWLALRSWGKKSHKIQEKEWKNSQTHRDGCHFSFPYTFSLTRDAFAENFFPLVLIIFLLALTCVLFFVRLEEHIKNHKHAAKQFYRFFVLSHSLSRSCFPLGTRQQTLWNRERRWQWNSMKKLFKEFSLKKNKKKLLFLSF